MVPIRLLLTNPVREQLQGAPAQSPTHLTSQGVEFIKNNRRTAIPNAAVLTWPEGGEQLGQPLEELLPCHMGHGGDRAAQRLSFPHHIGWPVEMPIHGR